jgi:transcriptional regulator
MYVPKQFREDDIDVLQTLMREYSFATLVSTQEDGVPTATPLPFVLEAQPAPYGTLKAHMALGNPQWRTFRPDQLVLVIFQGPHAYISPSWYETSLAVPTWNYATVHAYGYPRLIDDQAELLEQLQSLIGLHEASFAHPWPFDLPTDYLEQMMKGIVGFAIQITRLEGKFKMSQNRSATDRERVATELRASQDPMHCEVAALVGGARQRRPQEQD